MQHSAMVGNNAAAETTCAQRRLRLGRVVQALLVAVVLLLGVLSPMAGPSTAAWAWDLPGLPGKAQQRSGRTTPLAPTPPAGGLQEKAPPIAVQQLQEALSDYQPRVDILSPRDGALLNEGPWELRLRVSDWPLSDAGSLGLGAHLVVQIDDQSPLRVSGDPADLRVQAPALAPGSHRVTVYAAKPWGEAVKSPGAIRQIRVNRVAANPLSLPAPGSAQLIPISPTSTAVAEPVLLDWILLDAPLQNLRPGDGSWRLRVTVNGDSFLLDQNVPLWLQGWRPGSNSLLLELVDGLGEPLNPPFNSRVLEVNLPSMGSAPISRPRWLQGRLNAQELGLLLGEISLAETEEASAPPSSEPLESEATSNEPDSAAIDADPQTTAQSFSEAELPNSEGAEPAAAAEAQAPAAAAEEPTTPQEQTEEDDDNIPEAPAAAPAAADMSATAQPTSPEPEQIPDKPAAPPPTRISSSTRLEGSARELVNADGSLIKPKPAGPLAGLRQRLSS